MVLVFIHVPLLKHNVNMLITCDMALEFVVYQAEEEWQFLKAVFNNIKGPIEMNLTHLEGELKKMFCKLGGWGK